MSLLGRILYYAQLPIAVVLTSWVAVGRGIFGAGGWMGFITVFMVAPVLFIWLLLLAIINRIRKDTGRTKRLDVVDVVLLMTAYLCCLSVGFFLVDMGDTADSVGSAFSRVLGGQLVALSAAIAYASFIVGLVALAAASTYAIVRLIKSRTSSKPGPLTGGRV